MRCCDSRQTGDNPLDAIAPSRLDHLQGVSTSLLCAREFEMLTSARNIHGSPPRLTCITINQFDDQRREGAVSRDQRLQKFRLVRW
jgi:hypothetical protein